MSRNVGTARPLRRAAAPWLGAAAALTLAVGAALLIVQIWMSPPAHELGSLTAYLALSGAATLLGGWLVLRVADRSVGLTLQAKAFLSAAIGAGVALVNVLIVAELMFVSTTHDFKVLLALLVFSAIVTTFFAFQVAAAVTGRLAAVAAGIRSLAAGDYAPRIHVGGGDEVSRLARDVNALGARLREVEEQRAALDRERRDLTAAISHDLRTPLASVRAMVEALDDRVVEDPAEVARYYATMRREIERLSRMIDDLFELARLDAGALRLDLQPMALQEVAADVVDAMQAQARLKDVRLDLRVDGQPPRVALDAVRIERAIANLVRNALEHTPPGGRVDVRVDAADDALQLQVIDTGEGIEERDLPHIWERFYRAERSRSRAQESGDGAGLGLAIVRGIVEAHGGTVAARSSPRHGAVFAARLPLRR